MFKIHKTTVIPKQTIPMTTVFSDKKDRNMPIAREINTPIAHRQDFFRYSMTDAYKEAKGSSPRKFLLSAYSAASRCRSLVTNTDPKIDFPANAKKTDAITMNCQGCILFE